jgi:hypothetical protein
MKSPLFVASALVALTGGCASHHEAAPAVRENPYTLPLVSPGTKFTALPPAVQNTIRAEAGAAEIDRIVTYAGQGKVVYGIYFKNREMNPPLYLAPDGSVLNLDLTVAKPAPLGTNGAGGEHINSPIPGP